MRHVCPSCRWVATTQTRSRVYCDSCEVWMEPAEEPPSEAVRALWNGRGGPASRRGAHLSVVMPREPAYTPQWQRAEVEREVTLETASRLTGVPYKTLARWCADRRVRSRKIPRIDADTPERDYRQVRVVPVSEIERLVAARPGEIE